MIITLTKADFSSCKIGTLTTFNVRKSTTIGATVNIIKTSVERAGYSSATTIATIVLDEANYEGHAIKVMMGSTDVSSWYSVGNVIVPANTPITSNITISVSATAVSGGDPIIPDEPVTPTMYTFTINPTPTNSTVTLTASSYTQSGNSISVASGTTVSWTVSADGYYDKNGSETVTKDKTLNVRLSEVVNPGGSEVVFLNTDFEVGGIGGDGKQLVDINSRWRQKDLKTFNSAVTLTPATLNGTFASTKLRVFTYEQSGSKKSDTNWVETPINIDANTPFKLTMQKADGTAVSGAETITVTVPTGATKLYVNTTMESKDYAYFTYNGTTHNGNEFTDKLYHYNNSGSYASLNVSSKMAGYPSAINVTAGDSVILSIFVSATLGYVFTDDSGKVISDSTGVSMPQRTYQPLEYFTYA